MYILLRPLQPKEQKSGFRLGLLFLGEPPACLKLVDGTKTIKVYEMDGDTRTMSMTMFRAEYT